MRYLEQVAVILRRAGLIRSIKGASGGYTLAIAPENIVIGDALRELEGDMLIIDPPLDVGTESKLENTVRRVVFDALNKRIADIINKETLASLIGTVDDEAYMFYI
jgi:Rrf2 family protein